MFIGQQGVIVKREDGETLQEWGERIAEMQMGELETVWKSGGVWVAVLTDGRMITSE